MIRYILLLFLFGSFSSVVQAQNRPLGLGFILGSPTGLSLKYWKSQRHAYDAGAAWSFDKQESLHLHADNLWHSFDLIDENRTPVYYGIGVSVFFRSKTSGMGVRFPVGLTHLVKGAAIDLFIELAPVLELAPATDFDLQGGFGARYYFGRS